MLNPLLDSVGDDVMGFLNEIQMNYPQAISLASGRPDEKFFNLQDFSEYFNNYVDSVAESGKKSRAVILDDLGQYNRTKGIINELIVKYLKKDEQIEVSPEDVIVTVGTQEAVCIAVITLCDRQKDVIIVEDPTYVGITHFSVISGYRIEPIPLHADGVSLRLLEERILDCRREGRNVKIVYVIPDYQNPTGNSMSMEKRHKLLALSDKYDFYIMEDNAYGEFAYKGAKNLPIKAIDTGKRVIYLRSFSKTLYPSLRLGVMVADQLVGYGGKKMPLSDLMAKTKGYITVNTPSINQAIFGGILIRNDFSLTELNKVKIASIKEKRDRMLSALGKYLDAGKFAWACDIRWNVPEGGFFITVKTPFKVNKDDALYCAEHYKVIFTPMSFFYFGQGGDNEIRLAFSNLSLEKIETAIERLALYFKSKLTTNQ